jgi:hypothetical protein
MTAAHREFWRRHPGLVWSNPEADDATHIRAALVRPRFRVLLEIAVEFGLERLRGEWKDLCSAPTPEVVRATNAVERILANLEEGAARAAAGH